MRNNILVTIMTSASFSNFTFVKNVSGHEKSTIKKSLI